MSGTRTLARLLIFPIISIKPIVRPKLLVDSFHRSVANAHIQLPGSCARHQVPVGEMTYSPLGLYARVSRAGGFLLQITLDPSAWTHSSEGMVRPSRDAVWIESRKSMGMLSILSHVTKSSLFYSLYIYTTARHPLPKVFSRITATLHLHLIDRLSSNCHGLACSFPQYQPFILIEIKGLRTT